MQGTRLMIRQLTMVIAVLVAALCASREAFAFHAGLTFTEPPAAGGGGGVFYLGTKAERGFTCAVCHIDAPGRVKVALSSDPPELFESYEFEPGRRYEITVQMVVEGGETLGVQSPDGNYNGLGVTFVDFAGQAVGKPSGPADEYQEINFTTLFSIGTHAGETAWSFSWTAPTEGVLGKATMHLAVVDGNAGGKQTELFTDPFGDDLVMVKVDLRPAGAAALELPAERQGRRLASAPLLPPRLPLSVASALALPAWPLVRRSARKLLRRRLLAAGKPKGHRVGG